MATILLSILNLKKAQEKVTISAYLFVLVLKIVYLSIKENKNIKGLNNQTTFYTAHTADTT